VEGGGMATCGSPPPDSAGCLCGGPFELGGVATEVLEGERAYSAGVAARVDRHWAELLASKPHCFDGPAWTLVGHRTEPPPLGAPRRLSLALQRTTYRYLRYFHFTEEGQADESDNRMVAIGVGALVFTREGQLALGRRSETVAALPGYWSMVPVGCLDCPDPKEVLAKELSEELGLSLSDDVADAWCIGVVHCGAEQGHAMNIVFVLDLRLTAAEVRQRHGAARDRDETSDLRFVGLTDIEGMAPVSEVTRRSVSAYVRMRQGRAELR